MLGAMGTFYRGRKVWIRYKDERGKWVSKPTPYYAGDERLAESMLRTVKREVERRVRAGQRGPLTVRAWVESWIKGRERLGIASWRDEASRLRNHALPRIGDLLLDELRPRDVRELVLDLRGGTLAPRTVRHVYNTLAACLRHAVADELLDTAPVELPPGTLPPIEDKDPEWRPTAVFSRAEVEALISDPRIFADRRVLHALKLLTGARHGEVAGLRWRHYDRTREPLGCLMVANSYLRPGTKGNKTREVPVHPTLAAILAEWRLRWPDVHGRQPKGDDLIIPTRKGTPHKASQAWKDLQADLEAIGVRARRGHDMRRTFISLALADGARREHLELITHGAPRGRGAFDLYHTPPWDSLCEAVACLRIRRSSHSRYSRGKLQ